MMRRTGGMVACAAAALLISVCQPGLTWSVAGTGSYGNTGDSGPATSATLGWPTSVAATPGGGFSFADAVSCTIRHVDGAGIVTTIAGTGTCGFSGDGGAATAAQLNISTAFGTAWSGRLAVDGAGNHFIFDTGNARIRRIDTDGTITTFAEDDTGATRCLSGPANRGWLAATSGGAVYMACDWTLTSVQGEGTLTPIAVTVNGSPFFGQIQGITVDADDNVYASLQAFGALSGIYAIDPATGVATLVTLYSNNTLSDLARDVSGNFYAITGTTRQVVRIAPDGVTTVIAGNGASDPSITAQYGTGTDLMLTTIGISTTPNDGLLLTSGHVVYRLSAPGDA